MIHRSALRALAALWLLALLAPVRVDAQSPTVRSLSFDEAIDRAVASGDEVAVARAAVEQAAGGQQIAESQFLPQIHASLAYNRTLLSQYSGFEAPPGSEGDTSQGGGGLANVLENLPFGQANQWSLGVTLSQTVFAGGRLVAARNAADARRRMSEIALTSVQAQLVLDVAQAYFDALLADQMIAIVDSAHAQSEAILRQTELAFKLGQKSEFEMLRARVARDNQVPQQIQRRMQRASAHDRLKMLLNVPLGDSLVLTSGVEMATPRFLEPSDTAAAVRAPVRVAGESVEASRAQLEIAEAERWPLVSIVSRFAPVAYPSTIFPGPDDIGTDWTVGFNVSIPLFTGGRIGGSEQIARAGIDEAEARLRQSREAAALDARMAMRELEQAQALLAATTGTIEIAERTNRIAQIRFREGIATQVDLADARLLLQQALVNRAAAQRNVHVARVRLALLRDLPLGAGGMGGGAATMGGTGGWDASGGGASTGGAVTGAGAAPGATQQNTDGPQQW